MFGTLLNAAHRTYTAAIQADLVDAGFSDMPTTGYRIAVSLVRGGASMQDVTERLSVSKQAASRMVDVLVRRGYCERTSDPLDRRRVSLVLTDRGKAAAREIQLTTRRLEDELAERLDADDITAARATLGAIVAMRGEGAHR